MTVRWIEVGRGAWGAALLISPRTVLERVHGLHVDTRAVVVARILGSGTSPRRCSRGCTRPPPYWPPGWVDGVHALSAVGLAAADPHRARAGLTDAAIATGWSVAGYRDLRRGNFADEVGTERLRSRLGLAVLDHAPGGKRLARLARNRNPARQAR